MLKSDITYEHARRFVTERRYRVEFDNVGTLAEEFRAQDELLSALAKRTWSVLLAPQGGPRFITSDYPYFLNMEYGHRGRPGFLTQNTELFFPLSKTVAFIGVLGNPLESVLKIPVNTIAFMNRGIVRRADRQLFLSEPSFVTYNQGKVVEMRVSQFSHAK